MHIISIKNLRARCQSTDYGYTNYPLMFRFFRVISIYFTWLLIQTNLTPNAITVLGILLGVLSGIAYVFDAPLLAASLVFIAIIADFSDGEVSRYKQLTSKEGSYLDKVHHVVVHPFFLGGLVIWMDRNLDSNLVLPFGMLSVLNSIILPFVVMYAIDAALLKHLLRAIGTDNVFIARFSHPESAIDAGKDKFRYASALLISFIQRICDFPYVIVIFCALGMGFFIDSTIITRNILVYSLITYSVVTSFLVVMYLMNVLLRKGIARRLDTLGISIKGDIN